ncbi:hypothetical protein BIW11_02393 [Tropilaelaps mercedesae]|uniref:Alpha-1,3-mannosyl-glycoprotein 2-beta-N-acetylglucosaminyltransferase n=1 Tax=Tropilaelaps mercedesae TaxID=418985 RepID=A0A1V9WYH6_9ACAR|nr:hypothetical protein BIW11_02393 [Tropilaelaps mercedesae]
MVTPTRSGQNGNGWSTIEWSQSASERGRGDFNALRPPAGAGQIARFLLHDLNNNQLDDVMPIKLETQPPGVRQTQLMKSLTPVLVLACNRSEFLQRVLNQLYKLINGTDNYPVVISQDCDSPATEAVARRFNATYLRQPDQRRIAPPDLSVDLFDYFAALKPMLLSDDNVLCISGFNDNGKANNIDMRDPCRLWWTDFFPGLGWMTTTRLIRELLPKWPKVFWDDWLRESTQRKGRSCIRPEVAKTTTFGKEGVSAGQFFDNHLAKILLNTKRCLYNNDWIERLQRQRYDKPVTQLADMETVNVNDIKRRRPSTKPVKIVCSTIKEWKHVCKVLDIMDDIRGGVARNSFKGVVPTFYYGNRVFVVPP